MRLDTVPGGCPGGGEEGVLNSVFRTAEVVGNWLLTLMLVAHSCVRATIHTHRKTKQRVHLWASEAFHTRTLYSQ